jgi:hypothetical protein
MAFECTKSQPATDVRKQAIDEYLFVAESYILNEEMGELTSTD